MPTRHVTELDAALHAIIERVGHAIVCGTPLGLGKPVALLNALYARAKGDPRLSLAIITALSLAVPRPRGELERRFVEPFARRVFAGVPELDYLHDLRAGTLPANVGLFEFYFRPGSMLGVPAAQQHYLSSNYTHVARDMAARGVNAVLVMVAAAGGRYSLSCNPDLTLDVVRTMRTRGDPCVVVAQVNRNLPFMPHDAAVDAGFFDVILDAPELQHPLFGVPNALVTPTDHAIGILAAALVKDGGTLQLGIGSLGDAVAHWIRCRHAAPHDFATAAAALSLARVSQLIDREGGQAPFAEGLFASSEMFTWGMMQLIQVGVIRRQPDAAAGHVLQAAFFLGPRSFYAALRELPEDLRQRLLMTSVARINDLYGEEDHARRLLRDARFINICMKATVLGAVASDGLADGSVVSGVGGQYNFVAMAHELQGARSILLLPATRETPTGTESNIVFNYAHTTIPRHLRDIVITQYGIADLRSRTDAEVIAQMIAIADSRFQPGLVAAAQRAGKLPPDWVVPEYARRNTPEALAARLHPLQQKGLLPRFPLGTDFEPDEARLAPALTWLNEQNGSWRRRRALLPALWVGPATPDESAALARLDLAEPRSVRESLLRRIVLLALRQTRDPAG